MLEKRIFILLLTLSLTVPRLWAQSNMVYSCDFEDAAERQQWVLNPTANVQQKANLTNFWNLGQAGHFAPQGQWGMFIGTSETATTSTYNATKTIENLAYRVLPTMNAGNYTITFNWLANGKGGQEGLYACLVPATINTYSGATALSMAWFKNNVIPMTADTVMQGSSTWSVATAHFTLTQQAQFKLVFIFFSTRGTEVDPAPAVDNIEIFEDVQCTAPTAVTHTISGMDVNLQWKGSGDSYDIRTYSYETGNWQQMTVSASAAATQSTLVSNVEEGIGIFFLRAHCGEYHSEWVKYEKFIFHKGVRCIDYMDLNKNNCAYGSTASPGATKGVVDLGYADKYSRHTLHYVPGEIDPRTVCTDGSCLKTKPDDALASVRLGNWNIGNEAEQISYNYKVISDDNAILQLRYAVVMEDPSHDAAAQPRFTLSISGSRSGKITCAEANFVAGGGLSEAEGWHVATGGASPVNWKEWTTVSINLQDYIGETLKITLTTYDCTQSGHFGYAYFTLGCSGGEMSGLNCGEDNPTTSFTAPEGFNYRWYLNDPAQVLGTAQTFTIQPMDTLTYHVDVINKTNPDCYYTLTACGWPRIPVPMADYNVTAERCQNIVTFTNKSYVKVKNQITKLFQRSNEKITSLYWDFGDGTPVVHSLDSTVRHTYPATGGDFTMLLSAGISNDACVEVLSIPLHLPDLQIPITEEHAHACREDYPFGYKYEGIWFHHNVDTMVTLISLRSGCDSIVNFHLQWTDTVPVPIQAVMCEGDTYEFNGQKLTQPGVYTTKYKDYYGCDSLVQLTLETTPRLYIRYDSLFVVCADDRVLNIDYELISGKFQQMMVSFDATAQQKGMQAQYVFSPDEAAVITIPDAVNPTCMHAHVAFTPNTCSVSDKDIVVELRYATSVVKVKDGMLGVMNERYNGGNYLFDSFQWYKDGRKIEGGVYSTLSVTDWDAGHVFVVALTRSDDSSRERVPTCDIVYKENVVPATNVRQVSAPPYAVFTTSGRKVGQWNALSDISGLDAGVYIIRDQQNNVYKMFY